MVLPLIQQAGKGWDQRERQAEKRQQQQEVNKIHGDILLKKIGLRCYRTGQNISTFSATPASNMPINTSHVPKFEPDPGVA